MKSGPAASGVIALVLVALGWFVWSGRWIINEPSSKAFPIRGIDVSHHQNEIDWAAIPKPRVQFAYIKATEGAGWRDPNFRQNWDSAAQNGVAVGAYHFFVLNRSGREQALNFVAVVPRFDQSLPPCVDLEFGGNVLERPPAAALNHEIDEFISLLTAHYKKAPIVYTTYDFCEHYLQGRPLRRLWIRDIFRSAPKAKNWTFWQFNSRGRIRGVSTPVDLNVFAGDRAALAALQQSSD